jgi:fatty acid-binding protein DegV
VLREKVRTSGKALARLVALTVEAAAESTVDVTVQHMGAADRAKELYEMVVDRLGDRVREAAISEVGAAIAAHTGPGVLGVAVCRLP